MKKILIAAVFAAISSGALAADLKPYIEAQLGYTKAKDVDTESFTGSVGGGTATLSAKGEFDNSFAGGIELGVGNIGASNFRLGASYTRMNFDIEKVTGTLTTVGVSGVADGTYTADITQTVKDAGISLDNRVNLYMANAYYDFKNASSFTPFIGFGMGMADVQNAKDNEFAYQGSIGGKFEIDKNMYLGLKGAYTKVNGITDELDIKYKDMDAYSGHVLLGVNF
ncbi:COG3637 Opacity protein and related surface antigens [Methylophilaceae bacterium]